MVNLRMLETLEGVYEENLQQWAKEHPHKYVLIEGITGSERTFYKSQREINKAIAKYKGRYGPTFLIKKIPGEPRIFRDLINKLSNTLREYSHKVQF